MKTSNENNDLLQSVSTIPVAAARLSVSKPTIYTWSKSLPGFPAIFKLGPKKSGILTSELDAWIAARRASGGIYPATITPKKQGGVQP